MIDASPNPSLMKQSVMTQSVVSTTVSAPTLSAPSVSATSVAQPTVSVRTETPLLPRMAFLLISIASLVGVFFTGRMHGLTGFPLVWRWTALWSLALVTGFLSWRAFYLRHRETDLNIERVAALHDALIARVRIVGRYLAVFLALGATAPLLVGYLSGWQAWSLTVGGLILAAVALFAHRSSALAALGVVLGAGLLALWSVADSNGVLNLALIRGVHLIAFALWLGGALFNLGAAVPAGRKHANIHAVVAGARQLERFRWVVRFSLPTIIVTGLWMALRYAGLSSPFWREGIGLLVPLKLGLIVALVVIFITCPLYRACSPVRGVCNLDDLEAGE